MDAGAHDGLLTLPLARLPGAQVVAFEPLPVVHARLVAACAGLANVECRAEALGEVSGGTLALSVPVLDGVEQSQWASTAKDYAPFASPRVSVVRHAVPVVALDDLALPDLTAIKLDVEGGEYESLRGARATLVRCRPVLTLELEERHREGCTWAVPAYLDALGYIVAFALGGRWRAMGELDRATMARASPDPSVFGGASDPYVFNFYAWPEERDAEARALLPGP